MYCFQTTIDTPKKRKNRLWTCQNKSVLKKVRLYCVHYVCVIKWISFCISFTCSCIYLLNTLNAFTTQPFFFLIRFYCFKNLIFFASTYSSSWFIENEQVTYHLGLEGSQRMFPLCKLLRNKKGVKWLESSQRSWLDCWGGKTIFLSFHFTNVPTTTTTE